MKWLLEQWHFWFVLVCVVGAFRNAYFHLAYEPLRAAPSPRIGSEFEPLRPLLVGSERIGYVTDEPLDADPARSEEHTSELQSPCNLVCRLLLEKKKKRGDNEV